jgi:hypothetical protein
MINRFARKTTENANKVNRTRDKIKEIPIKKPKMHSKIHFEKALLVPLILSRRPMPRP